MSILTSHWLSMGIRVANDLVRVHNLDVIFFFFFFNIRISQFTHRKSLPAAQEPANAFYITITHIALKSLMKPPTNQSTNFELNIFFSVICFCVIYLDR